MVMEGGGRPAGVEHSRVILQHSLEGLQVTSIRLVGGGVGGGRGHRHS